jgi:hypothetical protein
MIDYRAELEQRGFQVARLPFCETRHHCRAPDGRDASIDLASGVLWTWGTLDRLGFEAWSGEPVLLIEPVDFLQLCAAAGLTIVSGPDPVSGNYHAQRDGTTYVVLPTQRRVLGPGFVELAIESFVAGRAVERPPRLRLRQGSRRGRSCSRSR